MNTVAVSLVGKDGDKVVKYFRSIFSDVRKDSEKLFADLRKQSSSLYDGVSPSYRPDRSTSSKTSTSKTDPLMQRALADIERYKKASIQAESDITRHIAKQAETQYQARVKQWQRGLSEYQKIVQQTNRSSGQGGGNDFFPPLLGGSRIGSVALAGSAAGGAAAGILLAADALQTLGSAAYDVGRASLVAGSNFEKVQNSLNAIVGSSQMAKAELKAIDDVARDTTGLRLEASEQGYQRLRAVSFEATRARNIIKELGEEKVLSGASEDSVKAVLFNFTQIASGGQKIGQELREILTQLPSLKTAFIDAFGTLSGERIQSQLDRLGTDAFFDKLLATLAKNKVAVGGVEDAYGKLIDELIVVGRELSLPVIPEITQDLKDLSKYLRDNEASWRQWGQNIKVIYQDVANFAASFKEEEGKPTTLGKIGRGVNDVLVSPLNPSYFFIRKYLENVNERAKPKQEDQVKEGLRIAKESTDAMNILVAEAQRKQDEEAEKSREKELSKIKGFNDEKLSVIKSYYDVAKVLADAQQTFTFEQEIEKAKRISQLNSNDLKSQIANQAQFFNRQIELNQGKTDVIEKLTLEKNQTLRKLNDEYLINEINTQKQIQQIERQILEKRRQEAIQTKQLLIRELSQTFEAQSFDITRSIGFGNNAQGNFEQLKTLTQTNFQQIAEITTKQYEIQLQNERLTAEERVNLNKQMFLDLQDLSEKNRQKQLQISDDQYREQINLLENYNRKTQSLYEAQSVVYSNLARFFNPQSFGSGSAQGLYNAIISPIEKARNEFEQLKQRASEAQEALNNTQRGSQAFGIAEKALLGLNQETQEAFQYFDKLSRSASGNSTKLHELIKAMSNGTASIKAFDEANSLLLQSQQQLQNAGLKSEIGLVNDLIDLAKKQGDEKGLRELNHRLNLLFGTQRNQSIQQSAESLDQYRNSLAGLEETLKNLQSGDKATGLGLERVFKEENLRQRVADATMIKQLQYEIANSSVIDSQKIQIAQLQDILDLRKKEQQAVIDINRAQLELSQQTKISQNEIRANVLSALAAQKDLNQAISDGIIALGEKTTDFLNKKLGKFADIPLLGDLAKFANQQFGANISKTVLDIFFPGKVDAKTGNPVLDENIKQTTYLKRISDAVTGQSIGGVPVGTGGGGVLGAVGTLLGLGGGNLGNRGGINSPYILNHEMNAIGGNLSLHEMAHSTTGGGNILARLDAVFGKNGKIWGDEGFGNNVGTYGTIGAGASLLGSLIGGRTGSTISGAGAGLGIGAQIGSIIPGVGTAIGAGVGAVVGGLIGLFTGGKRREEEGIRDKAMVQTLSQLNQIKSALDARPPTMDWQSGKTQADQIQTEYFNAMNQLTDKKTRNIAIKDGNERVRPLVEKIMLSADAARAWQINRQNTSSQFIGEFANGIYVSEQFKRYNGMLGGVYSGRDYIKALIGEGEMVLNPRQIQAVRNRAGFDAFADAGIPNYKPKAEIPKFNNGISFNVPTVSSNSANNEVIVIIEHNENISDARLKSVSINGVKQKIKTGGRN